VSQGPRAETMNRGVPPTEVKARTGELTPPGIAAARAAGMIVIGVAQTYDPPRLATADHVVPSLRGLDADALVALVTRAA